MNKLIENNKQWIDEVWDKLDTKLSKTAVLSRNKIPSGSVNGIHDDNSSPDKINVWTNGFWGGIMWLMYEGTKKQVYKDTAVIQENMLDGALKNYEKLDHDLGFMWTLTSVADYKITGDAKAKTRALYAASVLASRFNPASRIIRAWNEPNDPGGTIIDCMMNLPLLYWAGEEIGDTRFRNIAEVHADSTIEKHLRADGSVIHIVVSDPDTGEVIREAGGQGYEDGSSWTRGQAWALYGYILSYMHTGKKEYLDAAKRVAHYFIAAVCEDYVPKCDFRQPEEPLVYDTSAGAIAACGLIEIAKAVPQYEKRMYMRAAIEMMKALEKNHCRWDDDEQSILMNCTGMYSDGRNMPFIYGDYFFTEAMYKLRGNEILFW